MGDWPVGIADIGQRFADVGTQTSDSSGNNIQPSGSAHVKGAWEQLIASTAFDAAGLLWAPSLVQTGARYSIDLGVGAAGSERILIPDLFAHVNNFSRGLPMRTFLPISIPAGIRLAARSQSSAGGNSIDANLLLVSAAHLLAPFPAARIDTYGFVAGSTAGTGVDPGGNVNTKGNWDELAASTTYPCQLAMLAVYFPTTPSSEGRWYLDLGIGASGSERIVVPDLFLGTAATNAMRSQFIGPFPLTLPAGTRVAARAQSSLSSATYRNVNVILYLWA